MMNFDEEGHAYTDAEPFASIVQRRMSRRGFLLGATASVGLISVSGCSAPEGSGGKPGKTTLDFDDLPEVIQADHAVTKGYRAERLISWGEPIMPGATAFDPKVISAEHQSEQFGANNDFLAFMPLPHGSASS